MFRVWAVVDTASFAVALFPFSMQDEANGLASFIGKGHYVVHHNVEARLDEPVECEKLDLRPYILRRSDFTRSKSAFGRVDINRKKLRQAWKQGINAATELAVEMNTHKRAEVHPASIRRSCFDEPTITGLHYQHYAYNLHPFPIVIREQYAFCGDCI